MDAKKTIIRVIKNSENPYYMADKRIVEDRRLSWKAKGIINYLLSRPDTWIVRVGDLINQGTDGETAVRAGLQELIDAGYIVRRVERKAGRFASFRFEVHELPVSALPFGGFPQVENPHVNNNDLSNIKNGEAKTASRPVKEKKGRDPLLDHPAVITYREITHRHAPIIARPEIAQTVKELEKWKNIITWWVMKGYNPGNIAGMLETYKTGDHQRGGRGGNLAPVEIYTAEAAPAQTEEERKEITRRLALRRRAVLEVEA